ncbi:iron complex outermembrane recepter protein [Pedobacter steynii]|uniref:Iron complex outermembrane recepter protein n=1 Tax=Pedobacter steynii TaxID=430522 RepID=A0A1H0GP47_9SPHI|nr:SusC/RagA family TonB-linked outer membrane protein [Pedobacter steynii]NQX42478.1 SusC/RagA family TonB-linked outer membrane protein [Pedobacter steynii]SDO08582.1 iron complex outermembrane recepter protein [Pedobacter steynii]
MKQIYLRCFWILLLTSTAISSYAQQSFTGNVKDNRGQALPGVSINEKGTKKGTATNGNGDFSLLVSPSSVLRISLVGYLVQEITVGDKKSINVVLQEDNQTLNEVVVTTGFGVKKQARKLSYATQEIKGEDLTRSNEPNLVNALNGKVAGLVISQGAGGAQSSSRMRIRGNSSLGNNTQPLIVIDGVLIQPGVTGADSYGNEPQDFGNIMKNLNADDYESITVLKGAAASSLYGSKAQNGVLLITSKKGKAGQGLGISFGHTQTIEEVYRVFDLQNEFGAGINPTFAKDANGMQNIDKANYIWSFGPKFDGSKVRDMDGRIIDWNAQPNNILDAYKNGVYSNSNLAFQGATDNANFRVSYTNMTNKGILPNNKFSRDAIDFRGSQKLGKIFTVDAGVNYTTSNTLNPINQSNDSNPIFALVYGKPRSYDTNYWKNRYVDNAIGGQLRGTEDPYNLSSLWFNMNTQSNRQKENNLRGNIDVTATITPWLNAVVRGTMNQINTVNETKNIGNEAGFKGGSYVLGQSNQKSTRLQALLNASKKISDNLDFNFSIGAETVRDFGKNSTSTKSDGGLKDPGKFFMANSVNTPITTLGLDGSQRTDAIYAFGDISYKNMLTLNVSIRNDWSSTLTYPNGSGDYSYLYPSVGLAYLFTESLKNNPAFGFLSYGKIRANYGHTGLGIAPYQTSKGKYTLIDVYTDKDGIQMPRYGYESFTLGNEKLKNELTKEFEIGTELRFLDDRIGIDASFYKKNTYNQVLLLDLPSTSGVEKRVINAGNIQNQGIEILINATPIRTRNFEWNSTVNFARNKNKIISLAPGVTTYTLGRAFGDDMQSVAIAGEEYGSIYTGYGYASYQGKDANDPLNGQKLLKANGSYWRNGDAGQGNKNLGSMMERFTISTINNFKIKDFNIGFQVDAKVGGLMASGSHQYGTNYGAFKSSLFGRSADHGGVPRKDAQGNVFNDGVIPEGVFAANTIIKNVNVGGTTFADAVAKGLIEPVSARVHYARLTQWGTGIREYSTFENSWVALREVSVGYSLPKKFAEKIRFNRLSLNFIARNLTYIYNSLPDHINPEGLFTNSAGAFAEYGGAPYTRTFALSIKGSL